MTALDADRRTAWPALPPPLGGREHTLGMETADWLASGGVTVNVDSVDVVVRRMDGAEPVRTRRRLADLADLVEELSDETFGPGPYRVELWVREPDRVAFRCTVPAERGGGVLDRCWSLQDGTLVATSLSSQQALEREVAMGLIARAEAHARRWKSAS